MTVKTIFTILIWIFISENLIILGNNNVPKWPKQIETFIRFVKTDSETEQRIELYYDQEKNSIAAVIDAGTEESQTYIFLFDSDEWLLIKDTECEATQIPDMKSSLVAYSIDEQNRKHIKDFGSILYFDPLDKALLADITTLNGITVQKWESNSLKIQKLDAVCNVTHYITMKNWGTPGCIQTDDEESYTCNQIILIEVGCYSKEEDSEVTFKAEFFNTNHYISNREIFQQPPGVYCEKKKNQVRFPAFPQYFAFDFETYDLTNEVKDKNIWNFHQSIWFDKVNKLIRRDELKQDFEVRSTQIKDFNNGIIYSLNKNERQFYIWNMSDDETMEKSILLPGESFPWFPELSTQEPQYVGKRRKHDLDFDVWVNRKENDDYVMIFNYYFLKESGIDDEVVDMFSPVFLETQIIELQKVKGTVWQMINKYRTKPVEWSAFDVSQCFDESNKLRFNLLLTGSISNISAVQITENLRSTLLNLLNISSLRFGVPQIDLVNETHIEYSLTINAEPYKLGFGRKTDELSLDKIREQLNQNVKSGNLKFIVSDGILLSAVDMTNEQQKKKDNKNTSHSKFSGGALAGVGIAMLILGTLQGIILLTAYLRYKKSDR